MYPEELLRYVKKDWKTLMSVRAAFFSAVGLAVLAGAGVATLWWSHDVDTARGDRDIAKNCRNSGSELAPCPVIHDGKIQWRDKIVKVQVPTPDPKQAAEIDRLKGLLAAAEAKLKAKASPEKPSRQEHTSVPSTSVEDSSLAHSYTEGGFVNGCDNIKGFHAEGIISTGPNPVINCRPPPSKSPAAGPQSGPPAFVQGNNSEANENYVYGSDRPMVRGDNTRANRNVVVVKNPTPEEIQQFRQKQWDTLVNLRAQYLTQNPSAKLAPAEWPPFDYLNAELKKIKAGWSVTACPNPANACINVIADRSDTPLIPQ